MYTVTLEQVGHRIQSSLSAFVIRPFENTITHNDTSYYLIMGKDDFDNMHMEWRDVAVVDSQAVIVATYTPSKNSFNLVKNELGIPVNIKYKRIEVDL
ncbi:hypothetical protein [Pseudomonas phage U1B]|nr:hypothetical protein [Pseudomonas phage T2P]QYV99438.1 hypothetical protein [Pseudomonas phage U1B]QYV99528.1 hypothetical protein [Pseudomonas phage U5]